MSFPVKMDAGFDSQRDGNRDGQSHQDITRQRPGSYEKHWDQDFEG